MIETRLTKMLKIKHPIMLAGMAGVSYAELVAAVSEAGGYGVLGAGNMTVEEMSAEMVKVRKLTDKPFGVDLLTPISEKPEDEARRIIDGGASCFIAGLGLPTKVIHMCHDAGVLVMNVCGTVRHAILAEQAGCDAVVAQGTEGGGHTGAVGAMALLPQVADAVKIPVVAAGGIFDGRGLVASLALGCDGIWVGTRFVACAERAAPRRTRTPSSAPMKAIRSFPAAGPARRCGHCAIRRSRSGNATRRISSPFRSKRPTCSRPG